jgi:hypothetical protein
MSCLSLLFSYILFSHAFFGIHIFLHFVSILVTISMFTSCFHLFFSCLTSHHYLHSLTVSLHTILILSNLLYNLFSFCCFRILLNIIIFTSLVSFTSYTLLVSLDTIPFLFPILFPLSLGFISYFISNLFTSLASLHIIIYLLFSCFFSHHIYSLLLFLSKTTFGIAGSVSLPSSIAPSGIRMEADRASAPGKPMSSTI